ncbi:MAG: CoA pyrophosphatase [Peptostreptococcaceae bacterium]|nr:CoA pyrophosphatase [Peptostreptococcaceae bacterium]
MSKITIDKINKIISGRCPSPIGYYRFYSVLVPLVEKDNQIHVLYEVRSELLLHQPGEVCFPGGAMEEGETEEECAIRETCEELGIKADTIKITGQLDTLYTYSNFVMYSFLGVIPYEELIKGIPNKEEVKEYFLVPLKYLMEKSPYIYKMEVVPDIKSDFPYDIVNFKEGYNWRKGRGEVPIYSYEDKVIWGLTARITKRMVEIIKGEEGGGAKLVLK